MPLNPCSCPTMHICLLSCLVFPLSHIVPHFSFLHSPFCAQPACTEPVLSCTCCCSHSHFSSCLYLWTQHFLAYSYSKFVSYKAVTDLLQHSSLSAAVGLLYKWSSPSLVFIRTHLRHLLWILPCYVLRNFTPLWSILQHFSALPLYDPSSLTFN